MCIRDIKSTGSLPSKAMQLSTNRVNFTNSSVAQFNYVTFLSQFRSRRKGVQDIGNIVRLHNDDFALLKAEVSPKIKLLRAVSKCLINNRALVLYVPPKKLKMFAPKTMQWYRFQMLVLKRENYKVHLECDLKISVMVIKVLINSEANVLCTIYVPRSSLTSEGQS